MRTFAPALLLFAAQLLAAAPSGASPEADGKTGREHNAFAADDGARPYTPARGGEDPNPLGANAWAAPSPTAVPVDLGREASSPMPSLRLRASGFPRGIDRPPQPVA